MDTVLSWLAAYLWEPFAHFFLNGFCVNLIRPLVVLVPLVIIFGKVGRGLGLPQLFRPQSGYDRLFIGVGVGILVWQAILAGYLFEEFATNYTFDRPPFCEQRSIETVPAGATGEAVRYRLPPGDVVSIVWYAGALVVGVGVSLVVIGEPYSLIRRLVMRIERKRNREPSANGYESATKRDLQRMPSLVPLVIGIALGLALMVVVSWALLPARAVPQLDLSGPRECVNKIGECAVHTAGYGRAARRDARWEEYQKVHTSLVRPDGTFEPDKRAKVIDDSKQADERVEKAGPAVFAKYYPVYGLFLVGVVLALGVFVYLAADPWHRLFKLGRPTFSPAAGLIFLLHLALFVQTVADYFLPVPQLVYLSLAVLTVLSARKYKLRHPNLLAEGQPLRDLQKHYDDVQKAHDAWVQELAATPAAEPEQQPTPPPPVPAPPAPPPAPVPAGGRKPQLYNRDLVWWNDGTKKPLVLLCVSGGGSRAAAWTMKVLTELERRIEGKQKRWRLPYHIRLVAGASGGMIGASYYVSALDEPATNGHPPAHRYTPDAFTKSGKRKPADTLTLGELNHTIRGDFLTPIVHTMLTRDLPGLLLPRFLPPLAGYDRGLAMEWAWRRMLHRGATEYAGHRQDPRAEYTPNGLTHTFDDLWDGEKAGWRPSLVFSPMMVEDGRQLLISNLDLLDILHNVGDSLDPTQPTGLISREAVEFFRLFPDATQFQVGTAARMAGSFPYVLPAVPLPTHPRRRVVDAGYYDNYGVGVAASWLFNNLDWVGQNASRVAIVQIRDGLSTADRLLTRPTDGEPDDVGLGTEWLTTPPAGLYQARVSSNMLRNDNLLHLLHQRVRQRFGGHLPFVTPAFELPAGGDVSLSYTLTEPEKELIDDCLPGDEKRRTDPELKKEVDQLEQRVNAFVEWFVA